MTRTGRPRAFDTQQALARARDLFWSRGYAATSVQDLVDELGVQRGSLYAAFGDKHDLYLKAVALYDKDNREHLKAILRDGPVLPALRRMLLDPSALTGAPEHPRGRRGCLVGNTTAELVPGDDAARTLAADAYNGFIEIVTAALTRAQATGEVSASATPEAQARMLLLLFQGSALVARVQPDPDSLAASIDAALDALRPAAATAPPMLTGVRQQPDRSAQLQVGGPWQLHGQSGGENSKTTGRIVSRCGRFADTVVLAVGGTPGRAAPTLAVRARPSGYFDGAERENRKREWRLPSRDLGAYAQAVQDKAFR
jgi:TetR/AcrR family transcriptional regulator, transcriptional repressor for nem operon